MSKIKQVVYVDVLFCLNMIISFLLILAAERLLKRKAKTFRVLLGAVMGGVYSFTVFLPQLNTALSLFSRLAFLFAVTYAVFGWKRARRFFRCFFVLSGVSLLFAGGMFGIWLLFKPQGFIIKNGSFYVDVSFLTLVLSAAGIYAGVWLFSRFLAKRRTESAACHVLLNYGSKLISVNGVVDTGNTLADSFTGKYVSVIDFTTAQRLLPKEMVSYGKNFSTLPSNMHLTVSGTVGGNSLLPVFTVDLLTVNLPDSSFVFKNAAVAISSCEKFAKNVSVLINADLINQGGERFDKKINSKNKSMGSQQKKQKHILHKRSSDSAAASCSAGRKGYNATHRAGR